jgi:hypothetical protein
MPVQNVQSIVVSNEGTRDGSLVNQLKASWWLALLLAVPLSVAANLITPYIQDWLSLRNEGLALDRITELKTEYLKVERYASNPELLNTYLISLVLESALYLSFVMIINHITGFLVGIGQPLIYAHLKSGVTSKWRLILYALRPLHTSVAIIGLLLILNLCKEGLSTYSKVQQFETYKAKIESETGSVSGRG